MNSNDKIYVAGNTGLVGSAIVRKLLEKGFKNLVFTPYSEYDLRNQECVNNFFETEKPEYVFLAAAKVGGILANKNFPAEFIYDNLMIQSNTIHAAYLFNVKKLLFLGSSCIYPRICPQPIKEEYLLTGSLEPTNEAYALAKIAGLKMCSYYRQQYGCDYISAMPTNLFGPGDNFDLNTSHAMPALIRKFHDAKVNNSKLVLWGTGKPKREFLYIEDLADALLFLMNNYSSEQHVNIGTGKDITIFELAQIVKSVIGFDGDISWDDTKPDGTPQKLLDVSKLHNLGWHHSISLLKGIQLTYEWFLNNIKE